MENEFYNSNQEEMVRECESTAFFNTNEFRHVRNKEKIKYNHI